MRRLGFGLLCIISATAIGGDALARTHRGAPPPPPVADSNPFSFLFGNLSSSGAGEWRPQASAVPREVVSYGGGQAPGTIVISTSERRLYYVLGGGQAIRYGVGVGRPGFEWSGVRSVSAKRAWPDWTPPAQMLRRRPDLPRHMAGGINNPLGARAMYLGGTQYRIHGSNEPETIGHAVSSGCIRMTNDDVVDLYNRVRVGTRVIVQR
ncbi:L,D-transpeptidase [Methylocystis bryophila]|uniref:L,D-transpeptidase n=1 Tax=Methylocystis bryophila TaxID=655015 RepID=A0A1W6MQJ6_9HYPH|nr:L,D-transpeptidase [Methylocystis bryophila]ARN79857.1 L,D-transpeptidase [Methylocystis bryophila]BDV39744.1 L,D-transpeptidase [Methylocystis bryophila]